MTKNPFASALLTAFGLGKTARVVSEQQRSMALVRDSANTVSAESRTVVAAVMKATDEAAGFK